jgi:hypothetical protein
MSTEALKQSVVERLNTEAAARRADKQLRQEQQREECDPRENTQAFLQSFGLQLARLSEGVAQLEASSSSSDTSTQEAACNAQLDGLLQLEQQASQAAYFLPQYDLRQCLASITSLRQRVEATRATADPKRKFAFRSKVARSKAAAAAPPGGLQDAASKDQQQQQQQAASAAAASDSTNPSSTPSSTKDGWPAAVSEQDLQLIAAGHGIMGRSHASIQINAQQLEGSDFVLANLDHCSVHLIGRMPALRIQGLSHCSVTAGPVTGATFINGAEHCSFHLASYQVRIHHVTSSTFRLRTRSRPIIERCSGLLFGPLVDTAAAAGVASTTAAAGTPEAAQAATGSSSSPPSGGTAGNSSSSSSSAALLDAGSATSTIVPCTAPQQQQQQQQEQPRVTSTPAATVAASQAPRSQQQQQQSLDVLVQLLAAAQLSEDGGHWCQVDDFDWVKATPSPNWRVLGSSSSSGAVV